MYASPADRSRSRAYRRSCHESGLINSMRSSLQLAMVLLLASIAAFAQSSGGAAAPGAVASAPSADELLQQLQSAARKSDADLAALHIDRWKADASSRQQAEASVLSIRRNLTYAVPELVQHVQSAPASAGANFRLYRNLNVLCDTFATLAETAGAFGPKEHYAMLARDVDELDQLRHQLAERVDQLTAASDMELARLRKLQTPAAPAKAASKIVIDDNATPPAKKKAKPAAGQSSPPSQ